MSKIDSNEQAQRLAQAIVGRILSFNEDTIIEGIKNDNLLTLLKDEIGKGQDLYTSRVSDEILKTTNYYNLAIVDTIIAQKGRSIKSKIWD